MKKRLLHAAQGAPARPAGIHFTGKHCLLARAKITRDVSRWPIRRAMMIYGHGDGREAHFGDGRDDIRHA